MPGASSAGSRASAALAQAAAAGAGGVPSEAAATHAVLVAALAETLREHPAQQAAFRRAWS